MVYLNCRILSLRSFEIFMPISGRWQRSGRVCGVWKISDSSHERNETHLEVLVLDSKREWNLTSNNSLDN